MQFLEPSPERHPPWFAIGLAAEETTEFGHIPVELPDGRNILRGAFPQTLQHRDPGLWHYFLRRALGFVPRDRLQLQQPHRQDAQHAG